MGCRSRITHEANNERAVSGTALPKKNVNNLHVELGCPFKTITCATAKALSIQVIGTLKQCEYCALDKAKEQAVSKKAVPHSKILGERLFFDISFSSTPTFGGKQHWLLVMNNSSAYIWSFVLKEKSNLVDTMVGLIKNLKNKHNFQVQFLHCNNTQENQAFKQTCKQEGLGVNLKYTAPGISQ